MTTTIAQLEHWIADEFGTVTATLEAKEAQVLAYLKPLADQIIAAVEAQGKASFEEAFADLVSVARASVAAGLTAKASGQDPVAAAEAAFVSEGTADGITVVKNAEAGLIKATVAIAQTAVAS